MEKGEERKYPEPTEYGKWLLETQYGGDEKYVRRYYIVVDETFNECARCSYFRSHVIVAQARTYVII
jgi:hypothetical protein